jgi:hypothetical protein
MQFDVWNIESVASVDTARQLLSRLERSAIICTPRATPAAVTRAVTYMRSLSELTVKSSWSEHIAALHEASFAACGSVSLSCPARKTVSMDDVMIRLAHGSPQLWSISLRGGCAVTETTLLTLTSLGLDLKDITVDSLIGTVTESTLVTLLRSWPRLTSISIDYSVSHGHGAARRSRPLSQSAPAGPDRERHRERSCCPGDGDLSSLRYAGVSSHVQRRGAGEVSSSGQTGEKVVRRRSALQRRVKWKVGYAFRGPTLRIALVMSCKSYCYGEQEHCLH